MKEEFTVERGIRKDGYNSLVPELYYKINVFSVEGFNQNQILKVRSVIKVAQKHLDQIIDERLAELEQQLSPTTKKGGEMNDLAKLWKEYLEDPNWYFPNDVPTFQNFMEWYTWKQDWLQKASKK